MTTPFDKQILWVHWKGSQLSHDRIAEFAQHIKQKTPNVTGLMLKTSDGHKWQGSNDSQTEFTINGPSDITRWVDVFGQHGLDIHLWCVLRADDIETEAEIIAQACNVPGVKSMALDVEGGAEYFGGKTAQHAREMITHIRDSIPADFHLALNMDARGSHPEKIHINEWIPYVQSIHPMVYHWHFSDGKTTKPELYIDIAFGRLAQYALPVVPMLQTYSQPSPVPDDQVTTIGTYALVKGAPGISFFRIGRGGLKESHYAAIAKIDPNNLPPNTWARADGKRVFQVTASTLNARNRIGGDVSAKLKRGDHVEVDPASRTEQDGYVWWQHRDGWSAERKLDGSSILMIDISPGILPYDFAAHAVAQPTTPPSASTPPTSQTPADDELVQTKVFRVEQALSVYSRPSADEQFKTGSIIQPGDHLTIKANRWHENDGFIWWQSDLGWFTERSSDGAQIFATDVNPEINRVNPPLPVD